MKRTGIGTVRSGSMVENFYDPEDTATAYITLKIAVEEVLPTLRHIERQLYYIAKDLSGTDPATAEDLWGLRDKVRQVVRRLEEAWENA